MNKCKWKCKQCGKEASYKCEVCMKPICRQCRTYALIGRGLNAIKAWVCDDCKNVWHNR